MSGQSFFAAEDIAGKNCLCPLYRSMNSSALQMRRALYGKKEDWEYCRPDFEENQHSFGTSGVRSEGSGWNAKAENKISQGEDAEEWKTTFLFSRKCCFLGQKLCILMRMLLKKKEKVMFSREKEKVTRKNT